jgi:hypothetical protein
MRNRRFHAGAAIHSEEAEFAVAAKSLQILSPVGTARLIIEAQTSGL